MITQVFHAEPPNFFGADVALDTYTHVADVVTDNEDIAFERTNTIWNEWWRNEDVDPQFLGRGCRSTSVGDIVVLPNGKVLRCASTGWEVLDVPSRFVGTVSTPARSCRRA